MFLGTWVYSIISHIALLIHCWTSWLHLSPRGVAASGPPASDNPVEEGQMEERGDRDFFEAILPAGPMMVGCERGESETSTRRESEATAVVELAMWSSGDNDQDEEKLEGREGCIV